MLKVAESHSS